MLWTQKSGVLSVALILMATGTAVIAEVPQTPAPDFALRSLSGETLRLSEFRSEVVLLSFIADWCSRCRQALPFYESLHQQHLDAGLQVIGVEVAADAKAAMTRAADFGLSFPLLLDDGQVVSRLYELGELPLTVLIDREGNVRFIDNGFRGSSAASLTAEVGRVLAE